MELIDERTEKYIQQYSSAHDALLSGILAETNATHSHAQMISGAVQGKFLQMTSLMLKPRRVLEIGTFTGFSALCLGAGLVKDGILHTIELREEDAKIAQANFDKSYLQDRIILHIGNAKDIIPKINEAWDLVFIDADKVSYIDYYELTLPQLIKGGFILADNVLFHGQVVEENRSGKNAKAMHAFNEHVAGDPRTEQVILSIRDGISLIQKL